jgi:hypothetical protein
MFIQFNKKKDMHTQTIHIYTYLIGFRPILIFVLYRRLPLSNPIIKIKINYFFTPIKFLKTLIYMNGFNKQRSLPIFSA